MSATLEYPQSTIEYSLGYSMALQSRLAPSWQNRILRFAFTSSINMMTIAVSCVCINYIAKLQVRRALSRVVAVAIGIRCCSCAVSCFKLFS